jgi:trk system potassium uptake protein TrkA
LLAHVRQGDVVRVHALRRGRAEAIEVVVHGKPGKSKVVGRSIENIELPPGTSINTLVRGEEVLQAHHDTVVEDGDHVILFLTDRRYIDEVERLFQAGR